MLIVSANKEYQKEGFTAAVKLDEAEFERIMWLLKASKDEEIKERIEEIIKFASEEGQNMPCISEEDGDKEILLQIGGNQIVLFDDFSGIRDGLKTIFLSSPATQL